MTLEELKEKDLAPPLGYPLKHWPHSLTAISLQEKLHETCISVFQQLQKRRRSWLLLG